MMMTSKVLLRAAELVEQGWCQETYARNGQGVSTDCYSPDATRWCLIGGVNRAMAEVLGGYDAILGLNVFMVLRNTVRPPLAHWNDAPGRTADEVAALLRRAAGCDVPDPRQIEMPCPAPTPSAA